MRLKKRRSSAVAVLTTVAVVTAWPGAWTGASASAPSTAKSGADRGQPARLVRAIETDELGIGRPTGVAWDAQRKVFVVTGRKGADGTPVLSFTSAEQRRGKQLVAGLEDPSTTAYDPRADRVTVLQDGRRMTVGAETTQLRRWARVQTANVLDGIDPAGTTYSSDGTLHVLDATTNTVVSVSPSGQIDRTAIQGLDEVELEGLAYQPNLDRLYVSDTGADTLYALGGAGEVVATRDISDADVTNLQAMTFAPSGDTTDPASDQSLYLADGGNADQSGSVTEMTLTAEAVASTGGYVVKPTSSITRSTSSWNPSSPDPSGITYLGNNELLVSDGEVEELDIYAGVNMYTSALDGQLVPGKTGTTWPAWSDEPTGVEYRASDKHLFVSDDMSPYSIFEVAGPGADGVFGTTDDGALSSFKTLGFGSTDPEGVGYDTKQDLLLIIDGVNNEVYRVRPGGTFVSQVDVERYGAFDPEGITYDPVRETVIFVDDTAIWELDHNGSLLGKIDLTGVAAADKLAGVTIAPSSDGAGRSYYISDRGSDSDTGDTRDDGRIHEIRATLPSIDNLPPTVNAGPDQTVGVNDTATLTGSGTDPEGQTLTYTWSKSAGPGAVTFSAPTAAQTGATFSVAGSYTLRLTVSDGQLLAWDEVVVTVYDQGAVRTTTIPIQAASDDAREGSPTGTGKYVTVQKGIHTLGQDQDLALSPDWFNTITGLRFAGVPIPQGAEVVSAKIQFQADGIDTMPAALKIWGEATDDAPTYVQASSGTISSRPDTTAVVSWSPPAWNVVNETGPGQLTPELASVVQEIVNRTGWKAGNALAFDISGTGRRRAKAFERLVPPKLVLQYRTEQPVQNVQPTVSAGADVSVKLPASANLDAAVTDDGLPNPPGAVSTTWSKVSGEGTVTFGNDAAIDTTASFSAAGTYVLRLTANDGALSAQDDVTVTVQAADVVSTPTPTPTPTPGSGGGGGGGGGGGSTPDPTPTPTPDPGGETPEDPTVTLQAPLSSVEYAGVVSLSGSVADGGFAAVDTTVRLFVRRAPEWTLQELGSTTTDSKGAFVVEDRPGVTSRYYAMVGNAASGTVEVLVRPRLSAAVTDASVLAGTRTSIVGQVSPSVRDHLLRLQRWNGKGWRTIASTSLARAAQARYRFPVVPKASGLNRYRVVSPAQGGRARTVSPGKAGLVVKAYDAAIRRVNAGADVVVVRNSGTVAFSLAGWWLVEARTGARVSLPEFVVRPGRVVRIHSRAGASDRRNLFLGTGEMWVDRGVAELRDARLRLADRLRY